MANHIADLRALAESAAQAFNERPYPSFHVRGGTREGTFSRVVDAATGEPIPYVLEANSQHGWYRRFKLTADGKPFVCPCCGEFPTETVHGVAIRIERTDAEF
jgi:hypothetical protein